MAFKESLDRVVKVFSSRRLHTVTPPTSVSQIMTRDVLSVYPGQCFAEAVGLMANRPFRHVLVIILTEGLPALSLTAIFCVLWERRRIGKRKK